MKLTIFPRPCYLWLGFAILLGASCEKSLVTQPTTFVLASTQFSTDQKAGEAVVGLYATMYGLSYLNPTFNQNLALYTGLSSDELYFNGYSQGPLFFYQNALLRTNTDVETFWSQSYNVIYQANSILENVSASKGISDTGKAQFTGEAKFIRAFCYFYLVNLFGDVPLVTNTDYHTNNVLGRTPASQVYQQIIADLSDASSLLTTAYPTADRVRANKAAATALLARVYLYTGDWVHAESAATQVIANSQYALESDYSAIFLEGSQEAIFQFWAQDGYTYFQAAAAAGPFGADYGVTTGFLNAFETGDLRKAAFTTTTTYNGAPLTYPYKYKNRTIGASTTEYYMALRLAEQYLIRAEARAQQGALTTAVADVDLLRKRAGLADLSATISQSDLLLAIERERRVELCYEWGDRWFNLKRTGRIDAVLGAIKPGWKSSDALFPIPDIEIDNNPKLTQNPGY